MTDISNTPTWDDDTRKRLKRAGWHPGRDAWASLKLPAALPVFPQARRILAEFGGLTVVSRDQSTLNFDPTLGEEIAVELAALQPRVGRQLFPFGAADGHDFMYLLIDDEGRIYTLTDRLEPFASSFERALPWLVHASINKHQWQEDLRSAGLLGKSWEIQSA